MYIKDIQTPANNISCFFFLKCLLLFKMNPPIRGNGDKRRCLGSDDYMWGSCGVYHITAVIDYDTDLMSSKIEKRLLKACT